MRTKPSRLETDIGNHFQQQLRVMLQDTADTCEHGGMKADDIIVLLLSVLMCETSRGAVAAHMGEDAFMEFAKMSLQSAKKRARKKRH
jgi:hypothetical protein